MSSPLDPRRPSPDFWSMGTRRTALGLLGAGALLAGIPLPEGVAETQDALFRARFVFVAASASEGSVEAIFGDRVKQRYRLKPIA